MSGRIAVIYCQSRLLASHGDYNSDSWDRSSAWLERLPVTQEVAGSSPVGPEFIKASPAPVCTGAGEVYLGVVPFAW